MLIIDKLNGFRIIEAEAKQASVASIESIKIEKEKAQALAAAKTEAQGLLTGNKLQLVTLKKEVTDNQNMVQNLKQEEKNQSIALGKLTTNHENMLETLNEIIAMQEEAVKKLEILNDAEAKMTPEEKTAKQKLQDATNTWNLPFSYLFISTPLEPIAAAKKQVDDETKKREEKEHSAELLRIEIDKKTTESQTTQEKIKESEVKTQVLNTRIIQLESETNDLQLFISGQPLLHSDLVIIHASEELENRGDVQVEHTEKPQVIIDVKMEYSILPSTPCTTLKPLEHKEKPEATIQTLEEPESVEKIPVTEIPYFRLPSTPCTTLKPLEHKEKMKETPLPTFAEVFKRKSISAHPSNVLFQSYGRLSVNPLLAKNDKKSSGSPRP